MHLDVAGGSKQCRNEKRLPTRCHTSHTLNRDIKRDIQSLFNIFTRQWNVVTIGGTRHSEINPINDSYGGLHDLAQRSLSRSEKKKNSVESAAISEDEFQFKIHLIPHLVIGVDLTVQIREMRAADSHGFSCHGQTRGRDIGDTASGRPRG